MNENGEKWTKKNVKLWKNAGSVQETAELTAMQGRKASAEFQQK